VNAPVDKNAAAGDRFIGKRAAESGDRTVGAEADINMVNLTELARLDYFANLIDSAVETVDNTRLKNYNTIL
jgi:hypothetical protein